MKRYCSFCDKSETEVKQIIIKNMENPKISICNECIELCYKIITDERNKNYRNAVRADCFNELWGTD